MVKKNSCSYTNTVSELSKPFSLTLFTFHSFLDIFLINKLFGKSFKIVLLWLFFYVFLTVPDIFFFPDINLRSRTRKWPEPWLFIHFQDYMDYIIRNAIVKILCVCHLSLLSFSPIVINVIFFECHLKRQESKFRCYILIFLPGKMSIYWVSPPPEKWVYTEFSPRKTKYVLTHTHFSPHTSFSPLLF